MTLTPGAYLKCRRTACAKSHADVVDAIETDPAMSPAERVAWVKMIEADIVAVRWSTIVALRQCYPFDLAILERLSLIADGYDLPMPRLCRICAASDTGPIGIAIMPWGWAAPDLCIACSVPPAPAAVAA